MRQWCRCANLFSKQRPRQAKKPQEHDVLQLFSRLRIRTKLALLAGLPVIGALLLASIIVQDARQRAATADALGSIEDLAELSARIADLVGALQAERAMTAWQSAHERLDIAQMRQAQAVTDTTLDRFEEFLRHRDLAGLPPRLANELEKARKQHHELPAFRQKVLANAVTLGEQLPQFAGCIDPLIGATAALIELSDDATLLRAISALLGTMEIKERASRQHALLAYVFAKGEFPPGMFRELVSLSTEFDVYADSIERSATEAHRAAFEAVRRGALATASMAMRKQAIDSTDDDFAVDDTQWYETQAKFVAAIGKVEDRISKEVQQAAAQKVKAMHQAIRFGISMTIGVLVFSMLLTFVIATSVARSVAALSGAAQQIRSSRDFSVRAAKTSGDEMGMLTDAFNEMLQGIEERDRELREHRAGLERQVEARTMELSARNRAMRLVLDNVEQGLVTVGVDGKLSTERSAAFDRWFGEPSADAHFADHLNAGEPSNLWLMRLTFEQVIEDVLPLEVALAQMPIHLERGGVHYALRYEPLLEGDTLRGLLLMVSDVSAELIAREAETSQREQLKTFQRILHDRTGFVEFFEDARNLVESLENDVFDSDADRRRAAHTLKGNAALYEAETLVSSAHQLEQCFDEGETAAIGRSREELSAAWAAYANRTVSLLGTDTLPFLELSREEFDELLATIRKGTAPTILAEKLGLLLHEPVKTRFRRIAEQLRGMAERLGKPIPEIVIRDSGLRLPVEILGPLWSSFAHLVRNTVDHGLDSAEERRAAGKPAKCRIELSAKKKAATGGLLITLSDDGKGIDWEKIRQKARAKGLPANTQADLEQALLSAGFTTIDSTTQVSGRGVGTSAVADACRRLGGSLSVKSTRGVGTTFEIEIGPIEMFVRDGTLAAGKPTA